MPAYKAMLLLAISFALSKAKAQHSIEFMPMFGSAKWHTDSSYTNQAGERLQINKCLFYTTGWKAIVFNQNKKGRPDTVALSEAHYLIDLNEPNSLKLPFTIPANCAQVIFTLGVDSIKNTTGIQTGALDPARGMFWTWRTGYIMARLQGTSPAANTAGKRFSYDVGGFESPYNTVRQITLELAENAGTVKKLKTILYIQTDLSFWFNGKNKISIAQNPNCHNSGKLAMQLADNYQQMFTIVTPL
ncbi:MbnP family protein [Sediminibacterium sp. TEGAF015]|uniref:MbnP family protein n=1 Tax=Sediminibacterium sp. TEGAF015 TaxID=575378 RepID=UPI00220B2FCD|nr:hypothetical protein TEGAF0_14510 [Sediminibacterium sp. TEGAF015]